LAEECIHGLDAGLCDICFPKPKPLVEVVAAPVRRTAAARPLSSRPLNSKTPRRAAAALPVKPVDVGEQRIYHVTHVSNLAAIVASNGLVAGVTPVFDLSSVATRDARRTTPVAGMDGPTVSSFVPFFLSPNAGIWEGIRTGTSDPRLSPDAVGTEPSEFVILVSMVKAVVDSEAESVVSDGDAAHVLTRFASTPEANERMLRSLRRDEDSIIGAEYLVKDAVPFELITLIGVAHDRARDGVRAIMRGSEYKTKVSVYPPWFQRPEA
jgi:hypothetical protein